MSKATIFEDLLDYMKMVHGEQFVLDENFLEAYIKFGVSPSEIDSEGYLKSVQKSIRELPKVLEIKERRRCIEEASRESKF